MKQALSIIIAVALGVGVAFAIFYAVNPTAVTPQEVAERLVSPNDALRRAAIADWSEPTGPADTPRLFTEPKAVEALRPLIPSAQDPAIADLGDAFASRSEWARQLPLAALRYLALRAADASPSDASRAMARLREIPVGANATEVALALSQFTQNPDPRVRIAAMDNAAHILGRDAEQIVVLLLDDPDNDVARNAWLHLAAIRPTTGYTAQWRPAPLPVREAMVYATAVLSPVQINAILNEFLESRNHYGLENCGMLYKYTAEGGHPDGFIATPEMGEEVGVLFEDARRARRILTGDRPDLITDPAES